MTVKNGTGKTIGLIITVVVILAGFFMATGSLRTNQEVLVRKVESLDDEKVDKAVFKTEIKYIGSTLVRIETKLDKISERQSK